MYQVLIADDEPWITYGLVHLIPWEDFGYTVCGTAQNGLEALEMCRNMRPDLLISDIRMPGMDGIALLDSLRKESLDLHVVFVSGYSEFEYAQSAVRLGAYDYLLKPVEAKDLIDLLNRLTLSLRKSDQQSYQESYFALLDGESEVTVGQWAGGGEYSCVFFTFDCDNCSQSDLLRLDALAHISGHRLIFLRTGREKYSALLILSKDDPKELEPLIDFFEGRHCGASMRGNAASKLYDLYRQSDIAHCTAVIGDAQKIITYRKAGKESAAALLKELRGYLDAGHPELCKKPIDELEQLCAQGMPLDQVRRAHQELLSVLQQAGYSGAEALRLGDYRQILSEYASIPALFAPCRALLAPESTQAEPSAEEIISYVDKNFSKNLRIADIAEQFHFSQNYFSTFFRKKTGQTYVKYITEKRMALAKELLERTELTIQEVADRTGYGDYYQFNRVFKREVGVTPSGYREGHRETIR